MAITANTGTTDNFASATSFVVDISGATYATDDLLIMIVTNDYASGVTDNLTGINQGWTQEDAQSGDASLNHWLQGGVQDALFYKFATSGSETNPTITCTNSSELAVVIGSFSGVDSGDPFDVDILTADWASETADPTSPAITTNTDGAFHIAVMTHDTGGTVTLSGGSMTLVGQASNQCHCAMAYEEIATATTTSSQLWDSTSSDGNGHAASFALKPAAGGSIVPQIMHHRQQQVNA